MIVSYSVFFKAMYLSPYKFMWMQVVFDLPVSTEKDRKIATKFRNHLLDMGFGMMQFSVYLKFCGSREYVEKYTKSIEVNLPEKGKVGIFVFTDKQYAQSKTFFGKKQEAQEKNHEQLTLF